MKYIKERLIMEIKIRKSDKGVEMSYTDGLWKTIDFDNLNSMIDYILENRIAKSDIKLESDDDTENYKSLLEKVLVEINKEDFKSAYNKTLPDETE